MRVGILISLALAASAGDDMMAEMGVARKITLQCPTIANIEESVLANLTLRANEPVDAKNKHGAVAGIVKIKDASGRIPKTFPIPRRPSGRA